MVSIISKNKKGMFITLEGPDGSGKSTACKFIINYLEKNNLPYVVTREPGGTEIGENIRDLLLDNNNSEMSNEAEALLYAAARAQHVREKIKPLLDKGLIVISDRFVLSSLAYQGYGRNLGVDKVKEINNFAIQGLEDYINHVMFFDVNLANSSERVMRRKNVDRLENAGLEFHQKVHKGYSEILRELENNTNNKYDLTIIDSNKPIPEMKKQVERSIENILKEYK